MSVLVRVVRQFRGCADVITLAKTLVLPDVPTMGARLDLSAEGVEDALTVVGRSKVIVSAALVAQLATTSASARRRVM